MIKKYLILILITFFINNSLNSAGTNSDDQDPYVDTVSNKLIQWYKAMRLD